MSKKIALCLYGELRDYDKSLASWEAFIHKYEPDIYFHTWKRGPMYGVFYGGYKYGKFKSGLVEAQEPYDYLGVTDYSSSARHVGDQLYSMQSAINFIADNNIDYDFVVRSRFDLVLHNPTSINFDELDPTKFYVCDNHWHGNDIFDDNIMIGSRYNIINHNMLEWYLRDKFLHELKVIPSGEQLFFSYFQEYDLLEDLIRTPLLDFTLCRNII